jgi:C1A family cysteine protease
MTDRKFGWKKDLPDDRDHICKLEAMPGVSRNVDLRKTGHLPPVYNQGDTNTCTGNAIAAAVQYGMRCQSKADFTPSRLFIYYNERLMEGTTSVDEGAYIRDGIKSVASQGVVNEDLWPFDKTKITVKPTENVYTEALKGVIKQYSRVPIKLENIQNVLTHGIPIVFGATLYDSFLGNDVDANGLVPMPDKNENVIGGHAMLMVGSDSKHFIVRNSWGPEWGDDGYCYFPHEYLIDENLADDFWAIFLV